MTEGTGAPALPVGDEAIGHEAIGDGPDVGSGVVAAEDDARAHSGAGDDGGSGDAHAAAAGVAPAAYDGRAGALLGMLLGDLPLFFLTLGTYRFWTKTRARRYVWDSVHILGERLEYTGTPRELLMSFIKALVFFATLAVSQATLELFPDLLGETTPLWELALALAPLILGLIYLLLMPFAGFAARRYRVGRTRWHGIRHQQDGSGLSYGLRWILCGLFTGASLGLLYPVQLVALSAYEIRRLRCGDRKFSFDGRILPVAVRYLAVWLLALLTVASLFLLGLHSLRRMGGVTYDRVRDLWAGHAMLTGYMDTLVAGAPFVFAALLILLLVALFWFLGWWGRYRAAHTHFGDIDLALPALRGRHLFRLYVGNFLLFAMSLGLFAPLLMHRKFRLLAGKLQLSAVPDLAAIRQIPAASVSGEGLASFVDLDIF